MSPRIELFQSLVHFLLLKVGSLIMLSSKILYLLFDQIFTAALHV